MTAPTVKTFDDKKIHRLIANADPQLREYIKALRATLENQKQITAQCVRKLKEAGE